VRDFVEATTPPGIGPAAFPADRRMSSSSSRSRVAAASLAAPVGFPGWSKFELGLR